MDERAVQALPCVCGHTEYLHQWRPVATSPFTRIAGCAYYERLPLESTDEAYVRFKTCDCSLYKPNRSQPTMLEVIEESEKRCDPEPQGSEREIS